MYVPFRMDSLYEAAPYGPYGCRSNLSPLFSEDQLFTFSPSATIAFTAHHLVSLQFHKHPGHPAVFNTSVEEDDDDDDDRDQTAGHEISGGSLIGL